MFLLGAFLTGGAVGFAADRAVAHARPAARYDDSAAREEIAKQLNLSADQRHVIDSVMDWRRARSREIMQQYRPSLDSIRDSARVLMRTVLDATQQTQFTALIERNQRIADSLNRARERSR